MEEAATCALDICPSPLGLLGAPCVKRLFEWEIHGSANLATFWYVLRVTWCHCVCFSCYLHENGGTINVSKFEVLTSRLFPHIRCCSVESGANSPKFTPRFTQDSRESKTVTFVRILYEFRTKLFHIALLRFPTALNAFRHLNMSPTLSQLASLQSSPDAAADTLAQYQALPVPHHGMEEATYDSGSRQWRM